MPHFGGVLSIGIHGFALETQAPPTRRADHDEPTDRVWTVCSIPGCASSGVCISNADVISKAALRSVLVTILLSFFF